MRVVYKEDILSLILEAQTKAKKEGKSIEKIILPAEEYKDAFLRAGGAIVLDEVVISFYYNGVKIEREEDTGTMGPSEESSSNESDDAKPSVVLRRGNGKDALRHNNTKKKVRSSRKSS